MPMMSIRQCAFLFLSIVSLCGLSTRQKLDVRWTLQASGTRSELRSISAASPSVWASGRNGTYARTSDGGRSWHADSVPGAAELFFIDVHAVDDQTAYLLGTHFDGGLAAIYKTVDGGASWTIQYSDSTPGVFFDGMAFWDAEHGVAFSDPVEGSFLVVQTENGGASWERVPAEKMPPPLTGEAGFAASGTAIAVEGTRNVWFGTGGGSVARVYRSNDRGLTWSVAETPIPGGATSGIFGITFWDAQNGIAVGGDYTKRYEGSSNVIRTEDGGRTWTVAGSSAPAGCRYGVTHISGEGGRPILIATGPSGWGYSLDRGASWVAVDTLGFNTVGPADRDGVWLAGPEGRIARLQLAER